MELISLEQVCIFSMCLVRSAALGGIGVMTQRQQGLQPDFDLTGRIAQFNKFVKEAQQLSVEGYDIGSSILTPSSDSDPFLAKSSGPGESEQSVETVIQEIRSKLALPVDIDNSALAARLAGLLDDLHVAKERSESGAVAELEMKIIEAIPLALTLGDDDLCEICVYALGQLGEEAAEQAVEDSALVAATWQGTGFFERVQKMAHLSGHGFPFRRIVSVLSSPLKNRLYTYRPSRWVPPKSPAKTNLKTITTILHGTWSNKSSTQTEWWEPKGSFAQSLGNLVVRTL